MLRPLARQNLQQYENPKIPRDCSRAGRSVPGAFHFGQGKAAHARAALWR